MIIDASLYAGERWHLAHRLRELAGVVDQVVVVEAAVTFAGQPRQVATDLPPGVRQYGLATLPGRTPWEREAAQRNALARAIGDAPDDAMVLIGDADEIMRASTLAAFAQVWRPGMIGVCCQQFYYYGPTTRVKGTWHGTRIVSAGDLRRYGAQALRHADGIRIRRGGWHFSFFGGAAAIAAKIRAYSHQEYNRPAFTNLATITRRIAERTDPFDRADITLDDVPPGPHLPASVLAEIRAAEVRHA